ncbi:thioredoxin family protein [Pseudotabrizicola sp. 4114]|uniref:thioredoxin family protein n=1 Tax=Pseudotabrizicola sp. 4114 TaxID=2817731 RepID=UPI002865E980|nr:thiol-disulfide isomerase/thioredoxin [Pseudorhodobacter sp. 4114]
MNRRTLLLSTAALLLGGPVRADDRTFYSPGLAEAAMDAGEVVILDFWASWCSTCAAQERVIARLMAETPAYGRKIRFIVVDWDQYGKGKLSQALKIPRRSTLVALKGHAEIGRIVAGTGQAEIRTLFDAALAAAG